MTISIAGLGLCTVLGQTVQSTWENLLGGKFISDHSRIPIDIPIPRVNGLAQRVAMEATKDAGWSSDQLRDAALVVGTSKGSIEAWLDPASQILGLSTIATALDMTGGPRLTLSTACASGLHALIRAAKLIERGVVDRALVVAVESSVHPLFIGSFQRLGVLPPEGFGCRPFDEDRAGFLMSEAAAAVCLHRGTGIQIERFALGGDGVHLTHGDPSGRTLRRLLSSVLDGRPTDLIHAHGTGTVMNDAIELAAIQSAISPQSHPSIYSHKGALGHSLGAAGLVAVVINCLCHKHGIIPPNVRTTRPMPMDRLESSRDVTERPVNRSVSIASGFGGPIAVVSLIGTADERA